MKGGNLVKKTRIYSTVHDVCVYMRVRFTWHDSLVAAIRYVFSISRKPFASYDFHCQVVELVYTYLELFPPDSAEFLALNIN